MLSWSLGCGREEAPTVFTRLLCWFVALLEDLTFNCQLFDVLLQLISTIICDSKLLLVSLKEVNISGSRPTAVGSFRISRANLVQGADQ